MAAPDLARPNKVEAHLITVRPTSTTAITVVTCPDNSVMRLRTMYISNVTAAGVMFTLSFNRSTANGGGGYQLHSLVTCPTKNLFNATTIDDAVYLEAGDSLAFKSEAGNALNLFVSYELIT